MPYPVLVENAETAMGDGTVLRSTVYRPADDTESFPVLLTRTPYGRDLAVNSAYFNPTTVAAAGYVVIMQDCRGRFGSDGEFNPSVNEASDGAETVEWAARLPYSNGKVGMWGRSYFAETQWRAAQEAPAPLRALALGVSAGGSANNGALYRGGAHEYGSRLSWGHASASLNQLFREFADDPERKGKELQAWLELDETFADSSIFGALPLRQLEPRLGTFMNSHVLPSAGEGPGSPFTLLWDAASEQPAPLPTLHIGGWFDIFAPNTLAQYRRQLEQSRAVPGTTPRLIVGPWTHTNLSGAFPEASFGMAASAGLVNGIGDLSSIHTAWFDAALKDDPQRLDAIPPVLLYFMGENTWHGFDALPEPSAQRSWYLGAGGSLDDEPGTTGAADYLYDPLNPVPTVGGATMIHGAFPAGPATQAAVEARDDVLVFTSAPVEEKLTLFGEVRATFFASSSAVDTDFVVRLCRVAENGTSTSIADGIVRASWRESYAETGSYSPGTAPSPIQPGEVYEYTVSLWDTAFTFAPGERLRVQVTSSCHPRWDRNLNTGKLAYESAETVIASQSIRFGTGYPSRLTAGIL
ncbi:putative CocE/NonD family hydrolase [Pseudarthrobacter siccitolerans]|uniref:CocE/NonD family hydrolase n=1 Tax=Pseudarthrobacter siccitolerans TaxID=861266 RepID=A0ABU0PND8_9MICC|nr:CocE/NonD family hydrolase [Pseudarthrobacter siccitolerans]MDQ0675217.1 putative CocE/NonD family hydrolase [Pseudarthrobacter siccitolerans]